MTKTTRRPGRRVVAIDQAAAELRAADPTRCWCPSGPTTVARWVAEQLVTVEHRHHCGMASTWTTPAAYQAGVRHRAARAGLR